ncbi:hypothetical protein AB0D94_32445 [Streptomyces sp. NPDC048255]|uniref:hypothetical protein n=1 Tax=Streptomyces sp. NPDC048255 TaxID=3154713 RepID=UPI0033D38FDE
MLDEVRHGMASDIEGDSVPVGVAIDLPVGERVAIRGAFAARIDEMLSRTAGSPLTPAPYGRASFALLRTLVLAQPP